MKNLKNPKALALLTLLFTLQLPPVSWASMKESASHVHEEATLRLALEEKELRVLFEVPAEDLLGFEHKAKSKKDKATIEAQKNFLSQADSVLSFNKEARCKIKNITLKNFDRMGSTDHSHGHSHAKHDSHEEHSNLGAEYNFQCERPSKLKSIDLPLFKSIPSLKKLHFTGFLAEGRDFREELTPKKSKIDLN